jgi:acetyl-CoA carboxylase carboxyl transferase subunit alpha
MPKLTILDFERSIAELDTNLAKLHEIVRDRSNPQNTPDLPSQIEGLEKHRSAVLENIFAHMTPWDKVLLARHEKRPYTLDYVSTIFEDFQELHGDRAFADDGAIVAGLARFEGQPVAIVGQQKGRDLKSRQQRNFGYARPEGYRKAVRVMQLASRFGVPVITFIDTPGAAADVSADERGISEAIARSMYEMSKLKVPVISVIIGEGGSGGALGIGVANRVLMLEHSIYSVIAPEGCAAILWRDPERKADAASALGLTAHKAKEHGIIEEIIVEPLGGAHRDYAAAAHNVRTALRAHLSELSKLSGPELVEDRWQRFRNIGTFEETVKSQELVGEAYG